MIRFSRRGRLASAMVGALAATLMAPTAAPANAAAVSTAERAETSTTTVVSKNEFGKIRSRIADQTFGRAGTLETSFTPRRFFVNDAGVMRVTGLVKAKKTYAGGRVERASQRKTVSVISAGGVALDGVAAPAGARAAAAAASCDVLNLVLGPLDLNLLGLEISLNQVVLDIVAVTGAGNLLGNLLCAVVGLLDGGLPGLLGEIGNILNSILAILRL